MLHLTTQAHVSKQILEGRSGHCIIIYRNLISGEAFRGQFEKNVGFPLEFARRKDVTAPPFVDERIVESEVVDRVRKEEDHESTDDGKRGIQSI